jgi:hypothetical protein
MVELINNREFNKEGGLVTTITLIFFSNTVVPSLVEMINFDYLKKKLQQTFYIKKV